MVHCGINTVTLSLSVGTLSYCSLHNECSLDPVLVGVSVPTGTFPVSAGVFVPLLFDIYFTAFSGKLVLDRQTALF